MAFSFMADPQIIHYPKDMPLQFVTVGGNGLQDNEFRYWDEYIQGCRTQFNEDKTWYHQKLQQDDRINLMFHSNNGGEVGTVIKIYDVNNDLVGTISAATTSFAGFEVTDYDTGVSYTAYTHIIQATVASLGLSNGVYMFVIEVPFAGEDPAKMRSEAIQILDKHEQTKLIKYSNSINIKDVFYNTVLLGRFWLFQRVECNIYGLKPNSTDTSYTDEQSDTTLLNSEEWESMTFATRFVPDWMIMRLNKAFGRDMLLISHPSKYLVKSDNAQWDYNANANTGYRSMSIDLKFANNNYSTQSSTQIGILVWRILNNGDSGTGNRFPYFVRYASINRTGSLPVVLMKDLNGTNGPFPYTTDCLEVRDASDELILLNHANNVTKVDYFQQGYYDIVVDGGGGASMYYYPYFTETNYTVPNSVVLSKHIRNNFENGLYGTGTYFDIKGSWVGYAIIRKDNTHGSAGYGNGNPSTTHLVGGGSIDLGGDQSYLYHYNQMAAVDTVTEIVAPYYTQMPNLKSMVGKFPATLYNYAIFHIDYFLHFDWDQLFPAANSLFSLSFYKTQLTSVTNMNSTFFGQALTQLAIYNLRACNLDTTSVDQVFNEMYNGGGGNETFLIVGGEVYTDAQTTPAPPTAASLTARTFIAGQAWIITTD